MADPPSFTRKFFADRLCDQFEVQWKKAVESGDDREAPEIEPFLSQVTADQQVYLLRDLLAIDLHFRRRRGEQPGLADYPLHVHRFKSTIEQVLSEEYGNDPSRVSVRRNESAQPVPERIGRYCLQEMIGEGTFGVVYRARDESLKRDVAVKIPMWGRTPGCADDPQFIREAQIVAGLQHPNIVRVFDVLNTEDLPCVIVSELIDGTDLGRRIATDPPKVAEAVNIVEAIANALHFAHAHGLVHRDVKPANILLDSSSKAYLTDFGLALTEADYGQRGRQGGTVAYMSPEQARGEGHLVSASSDIFSLGVVLYELLAGRRPFDGSTWTEVLERIKIADPRPPRLLNADVPRELERICLKALSKRSIDRYSLADDMAQELLAFRREYEAGPRQTPAVRSSKPVVVPKGLRSFEAEDADFFIQLTPGPRDRFGIPERIRFWKTRLENTVAGSAFRVGVMYGISGVGKSSLVKAGIIPQLASHVKPVFLEATPTELESRIVHRMAELLTDIDVGSDLSSVLRSIRCSDGMPTGEKVVLIIDQFEQWLHANGDVVNTDLVAALRQCDGQRLQAVLIIRDDFWVPISRFMNELEIPLVDGYNAAAIDSFDERHAKNVLTQFGIAHHCLEITPHGLPPDEQVFLDRSISDLAEDGRVLPIRLAVFSEVVKERPWNQQTYSALGSAANSGRVLLQSRFSGPDAHAKYRIHRTAAMAVLQSLLPDLGVQIRSSRRRSEEELRQIAGYADDRVKWDELLQLLDGELRIVTPTDDERKAKDDAPRPCLYQLTHDYLVPDIRSWTGEERARTARGRASLRLEELTQLWQADTSHAFRPGLWDYVKCRELTARAQWTDPQRRLMRRTGQYHALRIVAMAALVAAVLVSTVMWHNRVMSKVLVAQIEATNVDHIPRDLGAEIIRRGRSIKPPLLAKFHEAADRDQNPPLGVAVALALLTPNDPKVQDSLFAGLTSSDPTRQIPPKYINAVCGVIWPRVDQDLEKLWDTLLSADRTDRMDPAYRIRITTIIARVDPEDLTKNRWPAYGRVLADDLANLPGPTSVGNWLEVLGPEDCAFFDTLIGSLIGLLRDDSRSSTQRRNSADILAQLAEARDVARAIRWARESEYSPLLERLKKTTQDESRKAIQAEWESARSERDQPPHGLANLALAAAELGDLSYVQDMLRCVSPDPTQQTELARMLASRMDIHSILDQTVNAAKSDAQTTAMHLVFALSNYSETAISATLDEYSERLANVYREATDPGLHSALVRFLTEHGVQVPEKLAGTDIPKTETGLIQTQRGTSECVFSIGSSEEGSPKGEIGRDKDQEKQRDVVVMRKIAVDPYMVTRSGYVNVVGHLPQKGETLVPDDCPVTGVSWYDAVKYCNYLSALENISPDEWCFVANEQGEYAQGMRLAKNYLTKKGYRLPTAAEWEFLARAGTKTSRFFGEDEGLLPKYAWYVNNSGGEPHSVGTRMPNQLGLFDLFGNAFEWTLTRKKEVSDGTELDREEDNLVMQDSDGIVRKGGGYNSDPSSLRASHRANPGGISKRETKNGFRVVRTLDQIRD